MSLVLDSLQGFATGNAQRGLLAVHGWQNLHYNFLWHKNGYSPPIADVRNALKWDSKSHSSIKL